MDVMRGPLTALRYILSTLHNILIVTRDNGHLEAVDSTSNGSIISFHFSFQELYFNRLHMLYSINSMHVVYNKLILQ